MSFSLDWYSVFSLWGYGSVVFVALIALWYSQRATTQTALLPVLLLASYCVVVFTFFPYELIGGWGSDIGDRGRYANYYLASDGDLQERADLGFSWLLLLVSNMVPGNVVFFFFVISLVYVGGHVVFCLKCFQGNSFPILASFVISFGFFSYGVAGLRSGFALGLLLMSVAFYVSGRHHILTFLFAVMAVCVHKTMLVPICAILLGHFFPKPLLFLTGWGACFLLSLVAGTSIQEFIGTFLGGLDERVGSYAFSDGSTGYNVGFRWDFVVYSVGILAVGFYYKSIFLVKDRFYDAVLCAFLAGNAFWLLMIRISSSDRVAYLSWFIAPIIFMTPLLRWRKVSLPSRKVAITLGGQVLFAIFMSIYRSV